MPDLLLPTFLVSWLTQVPTRKSDVCQKSQRRHSALQRLSSPHPNHQATETSYRNKTICISTDREMWGLHSKKLKNWSGDSWKAWNSCYALKDLHGRSQETVLQFWSESSIFCIPVGLYQAHNLAYRPCKGKLPMVVTGRMEGICPETVKLKIFSCLNLRRAKLVKGDNPIDAKVSVPKLFTKEPCTMLGHATKD